MRYLIDTNIFIFISTDIDYLDENVTAIVQDKDNSLYISTESVRELIVGYRNKGFIRKQWKTCTDLVKSIENEFYIKILPLKKEHMDTYSKLIINEMEGHKDPSDHIYPMPLPKSCLLFRVTGAFLFI